MNDYSSMTKADLLKEVGALTSRISDLERRGPITASPSRVPEAEAIAGCIRSLDSLRDTNAGRSTYNLPMNHGQQSIRSVLVLLAERYGVQLIDTRIEPCSRGHVDQLTSSDIVGAIQMAVRS